MPARVLSTQKKKRQAQRARRGHAHLPRDDFELSFECLIFAHDIPNANWEKRPQVQGEFLRDEEEEVRGAAVERTSARSVG